MRRSIFLVIAAMLLTCLSALADEWFADLEGSVTSEEFTKAERQYFTDAPNRYQKYELRGNFKIRSIVAWLDNDHIVFSARKLPDWEAKAYEHSRIISMNVASGEYKDTGYRGRLICLNHLGTVMIRQGGDEIIPYSSNTKYAWLVGKWGESLTTIETTPSAFVPNYLCQFSSYINSNQTNRPDEEKADFGRKLLLLPEHGYFQESTTYMDGERNRPVILFKPDGSSLHISEKLPLHFDFYFYPWMNAYFEKKPLRYGPQIFYPTGSFSQVSIPKLLRYWSVRSISMDANGVLTKAGMLWNVSHDSKAWKKQGQYLDTPTGLVRVDLGRGGNPIVSPDGCRVMDTLSRENLLGKLSLNYSWLVIDLCKDKQ